MAGTGSQLIRNGVGERCFRVAHGQDARPEAGRPKGETGRWTELAGSTVVHAGVQDALAWVQRAAEARRARGCNVKDRKAARNFSATRRSS